MGKCRVLKITIELVLPHDSETQEVLQQLQDFLFDEYAIDDQNWAPFAADASTITLEEDREGYTEEKQQAPWLLEPGDA